MLKKKVSRQQLPCCARFAMLRRLQSSSPHAIMEHLPTSLHTIACPHCHTSFPLTAALQPLIARERDALQRAARDKEQTLQKQAELLKAKAAQLAAAEAAIDHEVTARVQDTIAQRTPDLFKEARAAVALEMQDMHAQLEEKSHTIVELQKTELTLRKRERALEERTHAMALEVERKVGTERKTIAIETRQQVTEEYRRKEQEREKVIRDLRHQIEDAKRIAEQGSQQTQGEVLELALEQFLRRMFPYDVITPVPKGKPGADVVHAVYTPTGYACGTILWESKRTKTWNDGWLAKVKDDQREAKADLAIITTETLPKDINPFGVKEDVWVTGYPCLLGLAQALRAQLIAVALMRKASEGKDEKMEVLFNFLTGPEFRNRVQAITETFISMKHDVDKERLVAERQFAQREKQNHRVLLNMAVMYGDLQGLIGPSMQAMPALEAGEESAPATTAL